MASPHRMFRRSCNRPVRFVLVAVFFLMAAYWSELFYSLLKRANQSIDLYNKIEIEQFDYEDRNLTKKIYDKTKSTTTNRTKIDRLEDPNEYIDIDDLDKANGHIGKHKKIRFANNNEDRDATNKNLGKYNSTTKNQTNRIIHYKDHEHNNATTATTYSKISGNESFWMIPNSHHGVALSPFMKKFRKCPRLDFAVIGFAKCGTTSLQHWFANRFERYVSMLPGEGGPPVPTVSINDTNARIFFTSLCRLPRNKLHGLKQPGMEVLTLGPVQRYSSHFRFQKRPIKFIIGLRHPVSLFQSFYNYRSKETEIAKWVTNELKVKGLPHPKKLIGFQNSVISVNTDYSRFDIMLMGLGKVNLTQDDVDLFFEAKRNLGGMFATDLDSYMFEDIGGPVFIYDIHQLRDPNMTRRQEFQLDLMRFLGIDAMIKLDTNSSVFEIPDFPMDNANKGNNRVHETKVNAHNKTLRINICDEDFREVRELILENGKRTSSWILDRFLGSPDVFVGGSGYFQEQVKNYGIDFC